MANILLLEPSYKNKYPPLGLMKLGYYHKEIKKDKVRFEKGRLSEDDLDFNVQWDRVYITTLFTFEWENIKKSISYAHDLTNDPSKIFVGGIAATLMADQLKELLPNINVIRGLLNERGKLGYDDDEVIDQLPPDYSILDHTKYIYPTANAYFAYTTRGCGMNCSFCAVKTLEPTYISYVSIKDQINQVKERFGEKRDLLLMDNNVLISPHLKKIVEDLKELGFGKGEKFYNEVTKNHVQRFVDFNQGLDANLINEEKANLLAQLELRPVRIAFDHIEDQEKYIKAIKTCAKAGLREFSNYILFNSDHSSGKGKSYPPDSPEDLYNRLVISIDLCEELNEKYPDTTKLGIYSFPMKYIPLDHQKRGHVGQKWNAKYLRAVQVMLSPTLGKGVSSRAFFNAAFGSSIEEYKKILTMPERVLTCRGIFEKKKGIQEETLEQYEKRKLQWELKQNIWARWEHFYQEINNTGLLQQFIELISDNKFSIEKYFTIDEELLKKIYLFYLSESRQLELLNFELNAEEKAWLKSFLTNEAPELLENIAHFINTVKPIYARIEGYIKIFDLYKIEEHFKYIAIPKQFRQIEALESSKNDLLPKLYRRWEESYEKLVLSEKLMILGSLKSGNIEYANFKILSKNGKKASIYYFSESQFLDFIQQVETETDMTLLLDYCSVGAPEYLDQLANAIYANKYNPNRIINYVRLFGPKGVQRLVEYWLKDDERTDEILSLLSKAFAALRNQYADISTLRIYKEFKDLNVLEPEEDNLITNLIMKRKYKQARTELGSRFERYSEKYKQQAPEDFVTGAWVEVAQVRLDKMYETYFVGLF